MNLNNVANNILNSGGFLDTSQKITLREKLMISYCPSESVNVANLKYIYVAKYVQTGQKTTPDI